ncbi:claudin-34 [Candoia aspera]|uniref:claudin-34 n=1 Tax=Candoia aspera TaxID=51853 RepID=UPI002FD7E174
MAHRLNQMRMTSVDDDPLVTKYPSFIYTANKPHIIQRPNEKESMITKWAAWISKVQLCGYLLSILGWIMCITSTAVDQWRIWHVENEAGIPSGLVWIGIWRICYKHGTDSKDTILNCEEFTEDYKNLPIEIFLAQDLMSLACIMGAVAISFMSFALWNVFKTITQKTFLLTFFSLGGILNLLSGIMVLIPVSWNLYSVLHKAEIQFPEVFQMPVSPKAQQVGAAIYIGYVAAALFLLSSFLILCIKYNLQMSEQSFSTLANKPITAEVSRELCTTCESSVVINMQNRMRSEPSANELSSRVLTDIFIIETLKPQSYSLSVP